MLFNSLQFLIFFPTVVFIYFAIPHRFRWMFLLLASYYFYMCWKAEYVLLILLSTVIDYYIGIQMGKTTEKSRRRKFLIISLIANVGILFAFKYFNFFNDSVRTVFQHYNIFYGVPTFNVLLPIGISFYTFQTLSYSIEVYCGHQKPERHFGRFALYVAFFPQLVAGPIERSVNLLPQFCKQQEFDYQRVKDGLLLMGWGLFKKLVIADRVAVIVNQIYNHPTEYTGIPLILATYFFAFQIYCDFSGYSDIAIGAAKVLGFDLMKNFNFPYMSKSISEFWRRWHISLSSWFRDYLYIALGGNRVVKWRWYCNIFIVFLVSGLWHGANWTFVVWGALHGFYLLFMTVTEQKRKKLSDYFGLNRYRRIQGAIQIFITFHLVVFAWIFFRANSLGDAVYIITHLFRGIEFKLSYAMGLGLDETLIAILAILIMEAGHWIQRRVSISVWVAQKPLLLRWSLYYGVLFVILIFGRFESNLEFIYFQF